VDGELEWLNGRDGEMRDKGFFAEFWRMRRWRPLEDGRVGVEPILLEEVAEGEMI